ncbi:hypothetical protein DMP17_14625 [Pseudonocardia sp. TMWB2A]
MSRDRRLAPEAVRPGPRRRRRQHQPDDRLVRPGRGPPADLHPGDVEHLGPGRVPAAHRDPDGRGAPARPQPSGQRWVDEDGGGGHQRPGPAELRAAVGARQEDRHE